MRDRAARGCEFFVNGVAKRLFAIDRARVGAVWRQREANVVPMLGAHEFCGVRARVRAPGEAR